MHSLIAISQQNPVLARGADVFRNAAAANGFLTLFVHAGGQRMEAQ
jgi:hypothetical protein